MKLYIDINVYWIDRKWEYVWTQLALFHDKNTIQKLKWSNLDPKRIQWTVPLLAFRVLVKY